MISPNHKVLAGILTSVLLSGAVGAFISRMPKLEKTAPVVATTPTETSLSNDLSKTNDTAANQRLAAKNVTNDLANNKYRNSYKYYKAAREQRPRTNIASANVTLETIKSQRVTTHTRPFDSRTRYAAIGRRYTYVEPRRPSFVRQYRNNLAVAGGAGVGALSQWFGR